MGKREIRKIETRRKILEHSEKLFRSGQFVEVGVRDIAADCGIAIGTFYNYFNSKEEIVFALLDGVITQLFEVYHKDQKRLLQAPSAEKLHYLFELHLGFYQSHAQLLATLLNIMTNPVYFRSKTVEKYKALYWGFCKEFLGLQPKASQPDLDEQLRDFFWQCYLSNIYVYLADFEKDRDKVRQYLKTTARVTAIALEGAVGAKGARMGR